jgi:MerR family copper efflux transcriptional regulator
MTVGELARRTGLSIRCIREYERLGLIYSAGRSEANYRLFDEVALWCASAVQRLRSLGLTLAEIQELAALHRAGEEVEPIVPRTRAGGRLRLLQGAESHRR